MSATIDNVTIDYFTCTGSGKTEEELYPITTKISKTLDISYRQRPWRFFGYEGHIYSNGKNGHFAYGVSDRPEMGMIVQASGEWANSYVKGYINSLPRWTRMDLTVDVMSEVPAPHLCQDYYDWIIRHSLNQNRKYSLVQNNQGGATLYVGSRASNEFGRIYDKGVEAKIDIPAGTLWRYEVELKSDKAKAAASSLGAYASRERSIAHPISVTVYDWFCRREIPPIWRRPEADGLDLKVTAKTPTDDGRLLWLRKQVAPTVREFLSSERRDVLEALGITDFYRLSRKPNGVAR